ncbi:uncharacterized protein [Euphorbia lathyris]|uniref:uncharacterized protein isoform X2 n=1 Tax=Euphorbia lathyris TaxID=212925 RepID=UPI00331425BC
MLCSVPTAKSGSNWLDRLRSSKGFPAADNFDLDHFLTNHDDPVSISPPAIASYSVLNSNSNSNSESIQSDNKLLPADRSIAAETSSGNGDREWYGVMNNVLCDLFNMGERNEKISRFSWKKSARKQTHPKFCDVSMPCAANDMESIRKDEYVSDKNSNADCGDEEKEKSSCGNGSGGDKEELKGYSRSEVTIIDTSFDMWKLDKLVFRRKNIWKVVDKKGKSWTVGTKKRKGTHLDSTIGNVSYKKKSKSTNSIFANSLGGNFILPANDGMKMKQQEEVCKNSLDDNFQVPKKRSPKKSKKNCSSVVLIKAIASSKKCRKNLPKNSHLKVTRREEDEA